VAVSISHAVSSAPYVMPALLAYPPNSDAKCHLMANTTCIVHPSICVSARPFGYVSDPVPPVTCEAPTRAYNGACSSAYTYIVSLLVYFRCLNFKIILDNTFILATSISNHDLLFIFVS
jgi:hypothetical protein